MSYFVRREYDLAAGALHVRPNDMRELREPKGTRSIRSCDGSIWNWRVTRLSRTWCTSRREIYMLDIRVRMYARGYYYIGSMRDADILMSGIRNKHPCRCDRDGQRKYIIYRHVEKYENQAAAAVVFNHRNDTPKNFFRSIELGHVNIIGNVSIYIWLWLQILRLRSIFLDKRTYNNCLTVRC